MSPIIGLFIYREYMLYEKDISRVVDTRLISPERINQFKLQIMDEAVAQWSENPLIGLEIGQAYKGLDYGLVRAWYEEHVPEEFKANIGVAAFGSAARGELCFHSDLDLAIYPTGGVKKKTAETFKKELSAFLESVGLDPEIKIWIIQPKLKKLMQEDLVLAEMVLSSEIITGQPPDLDTLRRFTHSGLEEKALYEIFRLKQARFKRQEDKDDVFNLKWAEGGMIDFRVLRSIAFTYGIKANTTVDILNGLQERQIISSEEVQFLCSALSEHLIYRNLMHVFAGGATEKLDLQTRQYISQQIPDIGGPDQLKAYLYVLGRGVRTITKRVMDGFLQEMGIDPDLYDNFSKLALETQLLYARSANQHLIELAAWSSGEPEVLMACLQTNPSWSTLKATAQSRTASIEVYDLIEQLTRHRPALEFIRRHLAVNPSVPIEILTVVYKHTNNAEIREIINRRLGVDAIV